jgi:hypothetical protein
MHFPPTPFLRRPNSSRHRKVLLRFLVDCYLSTLQLEPFLLTIHCPHCTLQLEPFLLRIHCPHCTLFFLDKSGKRAIRHDRHRHLLNKGVSQHDYPKKEHDHLRINTFSKLNCRICGRSRTAYYGFIKREEPL